MLFARRRFLPAAVAALALLLSAAPAGATSPGVNGKIYFQACDTLCSGYDVYRVNPDGSGLENVTDVVTDSAGPPDSAWDPSVSADGRVLTFGVDSQATSEIWVMNTDGTGADRLTEDNLLDQQPAISPDGSRIVWNRWSPFPEYTDRDIWAMNSDGSGQELFFDGFGEDYFPEFTPDGQTVVMGSETGDLDIRKVPALTAVPPLTVATGVAEDDGFIENEPTISPDGSTVAFRQTPIAMSFGPYDIYAVDVDGGTSVPLFDSSAGETSPAYSPDGTKIVFSQDETAMIGNADGSGDPVPLATEGALFPGRFVWVPVPPAPAGSGGGGGAVSGLAPATRLGKHPPKRTRKRLARFTFSSSEPGSHFECKFDSRPFRICVSPVKRKVKVGRHRFQVRAVSAQSKVDPTPAVFRWRVLHAS